MKDAKDLAGIREDITTASKIPSPQGEKCKRCWKPIRDEDAPPGLCSISCLEAGDEEMSQAAFRAAVFERDKGVCSNPDCALKKGENGKPGGVNGDTLKVRETAEAFRSIGGHGWKTHVDLLVMLGFKRDDVLSGHSLWEADHIIERAKGGPSTLKNGQTLCQPCHQAKSNDFTSKRAMRRKPRRK